MSDRPHSRIAGIRSGFAALLVALAAHAVPAATISVGDWAAEHRFVAAEAGSPHPGKWNRDLVPYAAEIEDCVSFTHPCTDVAVMKSAQVGVSEIAINLFFSIAHSNPCPVAIILPTTDEVRKYNKLKIAPNLEATPAMKDVIRDVKSRDADSSTATVKRFRNGFAVITGANSSVGLQMLSARVLIFEEVSGYPADAGGRGDPVDQALARGKAWEKRKPKRFYLSTPELAGACRVTAKFEAGDQRRRYVACPHCGTWQVLQWNQGRSGLMWKSDVPPHQAYYVCARHGCVIEPWEMGRMEARGAWLKTYRDTRKGEDGSEVENPDNPAPPELIEPQDIDVWRAARGHRGNSAGRQPSFAIWQAYSPFATWDAIVKEWLEAQGNPRKLKVFTQQTLGLAWEEKGEAPDSEKLAERARAARFPWRRVPPAALFVTAGVDVQGDRLEWAVYAWSPKLEAWLIDKGVIEGDPETDAPWRALTGVLAGRYEDAWGKSWDIDALGIDAGYLSTRVYRWARAMTATERDTRRVFALDGRPGWKLPPLGTPKTIDIDFEGKKIGAVRLWPVGTFNMKAEHYAALRATIAGPEAAEGDAAAPPLHLNDHVDLAYCEQLTAEHLVEDEKRSGVVEKVWARIKSRRNEALDTGVYARALAHHLADGMSDADWRALAARRHGPPEAAQLALWGGGLSSVGAPAAGSTGSPPAARVEPAANVVREAAIEEGPGSAEQPETRRPRRIITSPYLH